MLYQERLLAALAKDLGAAFLCIDGMPAIKHEDVTTEDGKPSSSAFPLTTPVQRHFKVGRGPGGGRRVLLKHTHSRVAEPTRRWTRVNPHHSQSCSCTTFCHGTALASTSYLGASC